MLLFSMIKSAGMGLWHSRSELNVLLWSASIVVKGCVQRGRFLDVS